MYHSLQACWIPTVYMYILHMFMKVIVIIYHSDNDNDIGEKWYHVGSSFFPHFFFHRILYGDHLRFLEDLILKLVYCITVSFVLKFGGYHGPCAPISDMHSF